MVFTPDDISLDDESSAFRWASDWSRDRRMYGEIETYGNLQVNVPKGQAPEVSRSPEEMTAYAKYIIAVAKFNQYLADNVKKISADMVNSGVASVPVKAHGIKSEIHREQLPTRVKIGAVEREFNSVLKPYEDLHGYYHFVDPCNPKFEGVLAETYLAARKRAFERIIYGSNKPYAGIDGRFRLHDSNTIGTVIQLRNTVELLTSPLKLSLDDVREVRNELLRGRAEQSDHEQAMAIRDRREKFKNYWTNMKQAISRSVDDWSKVRDDFAQIPILPAGTEASRTWGIEVETVRADLVSRPAGWESKYDGSLESMGYSGDGCDCECSDCYDGYHDDCDSDDDGCKEFVSPVLRSFNSNGLRQLCEPLGKVSHNSSPGIHVHVGADGLSVFDVARLLRAYSIVQPFIRAIDYRETHGYCKDLTTDNIAYWLSAVRKAIRGDLKHPWDQRNVLTAMDIGSIVAGQPDDRYHDINLQALSAHGTIEFRVMGPHYDYDHLVRWAWFCREMVNVSRLNLPDSVWTSVRSMADVIGILRQYGSEIPSDTHDKKTIQLASELNGRIELAEVDA